MSEYGWGVAYTLRQPLALCFALYAAISARYGAKPSGPTYQERALLRALSATTTTTTRTP